MSEFKFFRWENVLYDYTPGGMCAVARTVDEARQSILRDCSYVGQEDLAKVPETISLDQLPTLAVWGGG